AAPRVGCLDGIPLHSVEGDFDVLYNVVDVDRVDVTTGEVHRCRAQEIARHVTAGVQCADTAVGHRDIRAAGVVVLEGRPEDLLDHAAGDRDVRGAGV